jgi:two-component system, NarL family, response regulator NreC
MRVVLAADDSAVAPELRPLLEGAPDLEVVSEAGDPESALRAVVRHTPDVLVLGLDRPGDITSLDTIRAVGQAAPETRVVVLATKDDARFVRHALNAGAVACILDGAPGAELLVAVRRAAAGEAPADAAPEPRRPPDGLTEREFEVLRLLALGHTNAEIAARLHLSVRTVEAHRAHLQRKLSRPTRAELVRYALDRGLLHGTGDRGPG